MADTTMWFKIADTKCILYYYVSFSDRHQVCRCVSKTCQCAKMFFSVKRLSPAADTRCRDARCSSCHCLPGLRGVAGVDHANGCGTLSLPLVLSCYQTGGQYSSPQFTAITLGQDSQCSFRGKTYHRGMYDRPTITRQSPKHQPRVYAYLSAKLSLPEYRF